MHQLLGICTVLVMAKALEQAQGCDVIRMDS